VPGGLRGQVEAKSAGRRATAPLKTSTRGGASTVKLVLPAAGK
jgi:hypothetical protein